ncbi:MAG: PAS domain-containing protein [Planctomycetales bacterium]|nr:PAS domain-containing protein [Planctomycetales bacterium]
MDLQRASREELVQEVLRLQRKVQGLEGKTGTQGQMRSIVGLDEKVIQLDDDDKIEYVNTSLARMLGVDRNQVTGKHVSTIDHFKWGDGLILHLLARCRAEGGTISEDVSFHDEGKGRHSYHKLNVTISAGKPQILIEDMTTVKVLENTFKRYVSPAVIDQMVKLRDEKDFFKAERYEMTVLFGDLRGFTATSEQMRPEDVRVMINEYLTAMTDVIIKNEATLDKFVGDEVMALFGAPLYFPDHSVRALKVGLEMQEAHRAMQAKWKGEGRPAPGLGVGINTGEMVIGNMGSAMRVDYSVLGHHVNLASRLCSLAQPGEVLLGENTFAIIQEAAKNGTLDIKRNLKFKRKGNINAKGISKPVGIIAVVEKEFDPEMSGATALPQQ